MSLVAAEILGDQAVAFHPRTVDDCVDDAMRQAAGQMAMKQYGAKGELLGTLTFAELRAASMRLACHLAKFCAQGDCIGVWGNNSIGLIVCQLAVMRIGATVVALDPGLRAHDLANMLQSGAVVGLLMDRIYRGNDLGATLASVREEAPTLRHVWWIDQWRELAEGLPEFAQSVSTPDDPALIVFTSGTTGKPKGVVLHHAGLVGNADQSIGRTGLSGAGVLLNPLPAYTVGAACVMVGALLHRMQQILVQHFDADVVIDVSRRDKLAWLPLVPAMLLPLVEHPRFAEADFSALEAVWMGGTIITPEHVEMARRNLGVKVVTIYGQTEAGGIHCMNHPDAPAGIVATTVGTPHPHGSIRITDLATGETTMRGVIGEIRAKSPYMTRGYFQNPESTAAAFDQLGYLRTGDLGMIGEDGNLRITGRLKEIIIRGGRNIYPRELEDVLCEFPGVAEAAVLGVPHERWGEEVAAVVRATTRGSIDFDALRDFVAARVAGYKVPKLWRLVDDFPRGSQAKIRKIDLVKLFENDGVAPPGPGAS